MALVAASSYRGRHQAATAALITTASAGDGWTQEAHVRRLIVGTLVSLDGVSGEPRSWATPYFDEHATERALAQLMASDARTLLEHDLVDELHFSIHPVILGSGTPLFRPGQMKTLRLTSLDQLPTGVVSIGFARADDDQEA